MPKKQPGLFNEPRFRKYSEIISLASINEAKDSITKLNNELQGAQRVKKRRIKRVVILAANRARVMSKNSKLQPSTRQEKTQIASMYEQFGKKITIPPKK